MNPDLHALSPEALAYLGDAVWELHVRRALLWPPRRVAQMHAQAVSRVRAQAQADLLVALEPHLSDEEHDWVRRGRNASGTVPRTLDPATYRLATALETLLGYLYLASPERLEAVLHLLDALTHGSQSAP